MRKSFLKSTAHLKFCAEKVGYTVTDHQITKLQLTSFSTLYWSIFISARLSSMCAATWSWRTLHSVSGNRSTATSSPCKALLRCITPLMNISLYSVEVMNASSKARGLILKQYNQQITSFERNTWRKYFWKSSESSNTTLPK